MLHPAMTPPLLTPDCPGVGGRMKVQPDDFIVEEIPAYEACGEGDFLYLWIEKRGVGAEFMLRHIARCLGLGFDAVGTAGLKDRHAVTRQWVSLPAEIEAKIGRIDTDGIRVLNVTRHTNKLKPGHLRGNRFTIRIREADRTHADAVPTIVARIREKGLPNFYGPQRFGHDGETAERGFAMLNGERVNAGPFQRKLYLSAAQSLLFNECLSRRLTDGLLHTVLQGDVMMKWPFGGMFNAEDVPTEQARFDKREIVTGGPMFGKKTFASKDIVAEREAKVLADNGLTPEHFDRPGKLLLGTRRHNLIYLDELTATWDDDGLNLDFILPSGSYATILLREIMKTDVAISDEAAETE